MVDGGGVEKSVSISDLGSPTKIVERERGQAQERVSVI